MIVIYSSLMALQKEGKVSDESYFIFLFIGMWNGPPPNYPSKHFNYVELTQYSMLVQPSMVMHWKTVNIAKRILSKEVIP